LRKVKGKREWRKGTDPQSDGEERGRVGGERYIDEKR
jgi:hypothetical protein